MRVKQMTAYNVSRIYHYVSEEFFENSSKALAQKDIMLDIEVGTSVLVINS